MADPFVKLTTNTIPAILYSFAYYYATIKDRKEDVERLQKEIESLREILKLLKEGVDRAQISGVKDSLDNKIKSCCKDLEDLESWIKPKKRHKWKDRLGIEVKWPITTQKVDELVQIIERHKSAMSLILNTHINVNVQDIKQEQQFAKQEQQLSKLPVATGAAFNSAYWQHKHRCLQETRIELLQQIKKWSTDLHTAPIYWLSGMAGTGKSTISLTLAEFWSTEGRLAASFFFSRTEADLSSTGKLLTTIAAQLANSAPSARHHICNAIEQEPDICVRRLRDQWEKLIFEPLRRLIADSKCSNPKSFVFVIDALDECGNQDDIELVIQLLSELKSLNNATGIRVQVFLTSRPEVPIKFGFRNIPTATHEDFVLHEIDPAVVHQDIKTFIKHELEHIRSKRNLSKGWPEESDIDALASKSAGLFIYAATVCLFVGYSKYTNPAKRLHLVLQDGVQPQSTPSLATADLDKMYAQVLQHSFIGNCTSQEREALLRQFEKIVGTIILLNEPLTPDALAALLQLDVDDIYETLESLNSVIEVKAGVNKISVLHISFRDFLLDRQRSNRPDVNFWIDEKRIHEGVFQNCLDLLGRHLRQDICQLKHPGIDIEDVDSNIVHKYFPLEAQYTVCNWIFHFQRSAYNDNADKSMILAMKFLETRFLYWLEALSLLKKLSSGIYFWKPLEDIVTSTQSVEWKKFIYDAGRFLRFASPTVEKYPLQLYSFALIFCPTTSDIGSQFKHRIAHSSWITHIAGGYQEWGALLQILEGHTADINTLMISPDGMLLVSASKDKTIRLWDPLTGSCRSVLEGHSGNILSLGLSPDGKVLGSASKDGTVRLWDLLTCSCRSVLGENSGSLSALTFSLDGSVLAASTREDNTLRLWDPLTGGCQSTFEGHSDEILALEFSPDSGSILVSASRDNTIRIWDMSTGDCRSVLRRGQGSAWKQSLAFSPDGRTLASATRAGGSDDHIVYVWDVLTGGCRSVLKGHSHQVEALKFSPDNSILASASVDSTVRLWDPLTGGCRSVLKHPPGVSALGFSKDGSLLASASNEIRLWDPITGSCHSVLKAHTSFVTALVFLQDDRLLASASSDKTVGLWNPSGTHSVLSEHHSALINALAFSPDDSVVASGSADYTVRLWDPLTGSCRCVLEGHLGDVIALAFSPDCKILASLSEDRTIRVWDPLSGNCRRVLERQKKGIMAMVFSPDSRTLAFGGGDKIPRLWDLSTGDCRSGFEGHSSVIWVLAFSSDGRLFASGSGYPDNAVRTWDPLTGVCQNVLEGHTGPVWSLAFSPDSAILASGSIEDTEVRLWDVSTGCCQRVLTGHSMQVKSLVFSPDGKLLVSASEDKTARLWDPFTGQQVGVASGYICRSISFSSDGFYLQLDTAILDMSRLQHSSLSGPQLPTYLNNTKLEADWITWNGRKVLRIPSDCRDNTVVAYHDGFFAITDTSHRLRFIRFNLEILRKELR